MKKNELTKKILKELLHYDPMTGIFTWKERSIKYFSHCKNPEGHHKTWNTRYSRSAAGSEHKERNVSYNIICISLNGKQKRFRAHRLAFLYMTGKLPKIQIDHEDGNGMNNRWINLRDVTHQENNKNQSINSNNKSGFTGVCWDKSRGKWSVKISINNKTVHGGRFVNKEDAIQKRIELNIEYGFHENHGRKNEL